MLEQGKEVKQNWAGPENSNTSCYLIFDRYL